MFRNAKKFTALLLVLILAASTYAFAGANTFTDPGGAGYGTSLLSGYVISNVIYDLNTSNPTLLDKVIFNIAPTAPNTLIPQVVLLSVIAAPNYNSTVCTVSNPNTGTPFLATCVMGASGSPTPLLLTLAVNLDIVASSSANP